jgi:hypothetical protein
MNEKVILDFGDWYSVVIAPMTSSGKIFDMFNEYSEWTFDLLNTQEIEFLNSKYKTGIRGVEAFIWWANKFKSKDIKDEISLVGEYMKDGDSYGEWNNLYIIRL